MIHEVKMQLIVALYGDNPGCCYRKGQACGSLWLSTPNCAPRYNLLGLVSGFEYRPAQRLGRGSETKRVVLYMHIRKSLRDVDNIGCPSNQLTLMPFPRFHSPSIGLIFLPRMSTRNQISVREAPYTRPRASYDHNCGTINIVV
jgi:hypothetical protein